MLAISTDTVFVLSHWAKELNAEFPMLSDHDHKVGELYGVYLPNGFDNRATFVIDKEGKIAMIEEGSSAIDPTGADTACSRLAHRKAQ